MIEMKAPKGVARWPDGEAVLVARPQNARLAVCLAKVAVEHQSVDALAEASDGPLMFMGFLKRMSDGAMCIVDENGNNETPLAAGDVLTSRHEISDHDPRS
jgi:hypothetical protein